MNKEFLLFVKWEKDELHIFVRYFVLLKQKTEITRQFLCIVSNTYANYFVVYLY